MTESEIQFFNLDEEQSKGVWILKDANAYGGVGIEIIQNLTIFKNSFKDHLTPQGKYKGKYII